MVAVVNTFSDPYFIFFVGHGSFSVIYLNECLVLWVESFVFFGGHEYDFLYPNTRIVPPVNVPDDGKIVKAVYEVPLFMIPL